MGAQRAAVLSERQQRFRRAARVQPAHAPGEHHRLFSLFFRNARVVTVPNAGHWVHHDQLDHFLRVVREFLDS